MNAISNRSSGVVDTKEVAFFSFANPKRSRTTRYVPFPSLVKEEREYGYY